MNDRLIDLMHRWVTAPLHPVPRPVLDDPEQRHIGFLIVPKFRPPVARKNQRHTVAVSVSDGIDLPPSAIAKGRALGAARRMTS